MWNKISKKSKNQYLQSDFTFKIINKLDVYTSGAIFCYLLNNNNK